MDPIANMLIMIKNASSASHDVVSFPYSNIKHAILVCLEKEGYVKDVTKKNKKGFPIIEVGIVKNGPMARITDVTRVSKPSRRVYMGVKDIRPVKNGHGLLVLSTPKGIMTDKDARKELVGGEALFKIW